jgi:hypothetical protein
MNTRNNEWLARIAAEVLRAQIVAEMTGEQIEEIIDFNMLACDIREALNSEDVEKAQDAAAREIAARGEPMPGDIANAAFARWVREQG